MIPAKLCIHPGLPKTGTTSLQKNLFQHLTGKELDYLGRDTPEEARVVRIRGFLQRSARELNVRGKRDSQKSLLISDENISMSPANPWSGHATASPEVVAVNAARLAGALGGRAPAFLITIRRQDTWLASRYAESAKIMSRPSQQDFEGRVSRLLDQSTLPAGLSWLKYHYLDEVFSSIHRAETLVIPQEGYQENPISYENQVRTFLDLDAAEGRPDASLENKLSLGDGKWKTKGHDESIELPEELSQRVLSRFRLQNQLLSERLGIDLSRWGYF